MRYRSYSALLRKPVEHLTHTQYIRIFNSQVSEVRKMVALVFIRNAFLRHDRSLPPRQGVDCRGADAATGGTTGNDQGIYLMPHAK